MASDYGLNFGFRRSDESLSTREGRQTVPATGTFYQGQAVAVDPAAPGYLKEAATDQVPSPGFVGVLVQEEAHFRGIYDLQWSDSDTLGKVVNSKMAIIWGGAGVKIWLKNTAATTKPDGVVIAAKTIVSGTGATWPVVGDYLAWDATAHAWKKGTAATGLARVTSASNEAGGYVEATLVA
jgi:hypothetical protein